MANVTGVAELRYALTSAMAAQRQGVAAALAEIGGQITAEIKQAAPKKTGALAASVHYEVLNTPTGPRLKISVGDETAFYAGLVEYGHWANTTGEALKGGKRRRNENRNAAIAAGHSAFVPPHPFVRPVIYRHQAKIQAQVQHGMIQGWGQE